MKDVLIMTHKDFDGCVAAMIVKHALKDRVATVYDVIYSSKDFAKAFRKIDSRMSFNDCYRLIMTDISIGESDKVPKLFLQKYNDRILWIDHHESNDIIQTMKHHIWTPEKSAALLTYEYFSKRYDVSTMRKLAVYADDYDRWIHRWRKSWALSDLFIRYWTEKFMERFKDGDVRFTRDEKHYLRRLNKQRRMLWMKVRRSMRVDENEYGRYYVVFGGKELNYICNKLRILNPDDADFAIVIVQEDKVSLRGIKEGVNLPDLLKDFGAGGHSMAAGLLCNILDPDDPFVRKFLFKKS